LQDKKSLQKTAVEKLTNVKKQPSKERRAGSTFVLTQRLPAHGLSPRDPRIVSAQTAERTI
jgi:hypothetical protein